MRILKQTNLYNPNPDKLIIFRKYNSDADLKIILFKKIISGMKSTVYANNGDLFTFKPAGNAACNWNKDNAVYCMPRYLVNFYFWPNSADLKKIKLIYTLILRNNTMFTGKAIINMRVGGLKYSNNGIFGNIMVTGISISNPKNFWVWPMAYIKVNHELLNNTFKSFSSMSFNTEDIYNTELNNLVVQFKKAVYEKQDIVYYKWKGLFKNNIPMTVKFYPGYTSIRHINTNININIQNNSNMPITIPLNKSKFLLVNGKAYYILWRTTVNNKIILASVSGNGCAIANSNHIFVANPGSSCSLHLPVSIPGFNKTNSNIGLNIGIGETFNLSPISLWKGKK
ncbi:MAG: hypothetical protein ACYCSB_04130 [bacterium]